MGLLDSLFGGSRARREIYASSAQAQSQLDAARQRAEDALNSGRADVNAGFDRADQLWSSAAPGLQGLLQAGYASAGDRIGQGYDQASQIWGAAGQQIQQQLQTGYGNAADLIRQGYDGAESALTDSYNTARNDFTSGYGAAQQTSEAATRAANAALQPFQQSGLNAQSAYDRALSGDMSGYQTFQNGASDATSYADQLQDKNVAAQLNARGISGGRGAAVRERVFQERGEQRLNSYMDRLSQAGARGQQAAGQVSSNTMAGGQQTAGLQAGMADRLGSAAMTSGQNIAGVRQGRGTALGENAVGGATALSNLGMSIAGNQANLATGRGTALGANDVAGAQAQAGLGMSILGNQSNLATGRAGALQGGQSNLANLIYGAGQQQASNTINAGNAAGQAGMQGIQNFTNLLGTGLQAFNTFNPFWQASQRPSIGPWKTTVNQPQVLPRQS